MGVLGCRFLHKPHILQYWMGKVQRASQCELSFPFRNIRRPRERSGWIWTRWKPIRYRKANLALDRSMRLNYRPLSWTPFASLHTFNFCYYTHATSTCFSPSDGINSPAPGSNFFSAATPNFLLTFIPTCETFPFGDCLKGEEVGRATNDLWSFGEGRDTE